MVPTIDGKRGNPVVWSRRFFPDLMAVEGDVGARHLIGRYPEAVAEVPVTGKAALTDVDTPEALEAVRAELERTVRFRTPIENEESRRHDLTHVQARWVETLRLLFGRIRSPVHLA